MKELPSKAAKLNQSVVGGVKDLKWREHLKFIGEREWVWSPGSLPQKQMAGLKPPMLLS